MKGKGALAMVVAKYIGGDGCPDLEQSAEYVVHAVSIPVKGIAFLRIVDSSGEDYLYPANQFEIVSGEDQLRKIVENNVSCVIAL